MGWRAILLTVLALMAAQPAGAQSSSHSPLNVLPGGFLVIDQDALFSRSAFGKRILSETDTATKALVAENRKIEAQLVAEEKDLTDRRPKMKPEEFRKLADAWDQKVQGIREEQTHKSDQIGKALDQHRREFFQAIVPVLADILRETQAVAILDKRTVLISSNLIDATDLAVSRIDAKLGDGKAAEQAVEGQGGAKTPFALPEPNGTGQTGTGQTGTGQTGAGQAGTDTILETPKPPATGAGASSN